MKFKTWWKKHWDEVMLIGGVIIGMTLLLMGMKVI